MNRLRILRQRARRGEVNIVKFNGAYVAATGRAHGACSQPMSKRAATLLASRWAMPCSPSTLTIECAGQITRVVSYQDGREVVSTSPGEVN